MFEAYPLTASTLEADRRRAAREGVSLSARLLDRDGAEHLVQILNITRGGLMFVTDTPFVERARIRIELPTIGWLRGETVWVLGDRVGVELRDRIVPEAFDAFVRLFGQPERNSATPASRSNR